MKLDGIKENMGSLWDNLAEGWKHLTAFATGAMTRFKAGDKTNLPAKTDVEDRSFLPTGSWAVLGGDVFEDDARVVVRLEVPGIEKDDLSIEVRGEVLVVSGEKHFEREATSGRWRVMQCAYGAFRRQVPLPAPVLADRASAHYKNGVLRIELPKASPGQPKSFRIRVD